MIIILAVSSDNDLKMALKMCRKAVLTKAKRKSWKTFHSALTWLGGHPLMVCSDGLTDMLTDGEIAAILKNDKNTINEVADSLVAEANNRGGRDNISLILIAI
jgi:serine/threonine protein phosphatase PrpC